MLYKIRKIPNQNKYRVYNSKTKKIHSYGTTLKNAKKQVKLLHMIDSGVSLKKKGNTCWEGYKILGLKKKKNRYVPNCVPIQGGAIVI